MSVKLPSVIPLLPYNHIVERLRNYAVQQEVFNHDNKRVSKELNELADAIENGQNATNAVKCPDSLMYARLAHRNNFRIGYHIISDDPNEMGRQEFSHTGGTILDVINSLLQEYRGVSAACIVLDDCVEE